MLIQCFVLISQDCIKQSAMEGHSIPNVFSLAMDLVLNNLMKFVFRSVSAKEKVSRQQLWLTNLVQTLVRENWLFLFLPKQETPCAQCC